MKLIVGLGNPGEKYEKTRHNIGFIVLDALAKSSDLEFSYKNKFLGYLAEGKDFKLLKPDTYMNLSGEAVGKLSNFYKIDTQDIIEVHDDLDLPLGQLRIQKSRGAAGHRGVTSTSNFLGTDEYWRLRIGIAGKTKEMMPGDAYVLSKFIKEEEPEIPNIIKKAVQALQKCITDSPEAAAQEYNQKITK